MQMFGRAVPGVSSGRAIAEVERIAAQVLPSDFSFNWGGASYQEKRCSELALALGALTVFLILSAQYENWSLRLPVLLAPPFGTFGALVALWLLGMTNDVYFQIGLVTLLRLAAKNAILIVEYASLKFHEGMSASAVAREASRLRFRPIIMASLAFIPGVLPLVYSSGAGATAPGSRYARTGRTRVKPLRKAFILRATALTTGAVIVLAGCAVSPRADSAPPVLDLPAATPLNTSTARDWWNSLSDACLVRG